MYIIYIFYYFYLHMFDVLHENNYLNYIIFLYFLYTNCILVIDEYEHNNKEKNNLWEFICRRGKFTNDNFMRLLFMFCFHFCQDYFVTIFKMAMVGNDGSNFIVFLCIVILFCLFFITFWVSVLFYEKEFFLLFIALLFIIIIIIWVL